VAGKERGEERGRKGVEERKDRSGKDGRTPPPSRRNKFLVTAAIFVSGQGSSKAADQSDIRLINTQKEIRGVVIESETKDR